MEFIADSRSVQGFSISEQSEELLRIGLDVEMINDTYRGYLPLAPNVPNIRLRTHIRISDMRLALLFS